MFTETEESISSSSWDCLASTLLSITFLLEMNNAYSDFCLLDGRTIRVPPSCYEKYWDDSSRNSPRYRWVIFQIYLDNFDTDNARPRPVFGVDLTEHLRHSQTRIAVVLEQCCDFLRERGMTEKGVFRVSGNNTKIRRMKAAFDAGQINVCACSNH